MLQNLLKSVKYWVLWRAMAHLWGIPNDASYLRILEHKTRSVAHWKDVRIGANMVSKDKAKILKEDVKLILKSDLWPLLLSSMKTDAYHMMYERSKTPEDMIAGKMLLHWQEKVEKTLKEIDDMDVVS